MLSALLFMAEYFQSTSYPFFPSLSLHIDFMQVGSKYISS